MSKKEAAIKRLELLGLAQDSIYRGNSMNVESLRQAELYMQLAELYQPTRMTTAL